MLNIAVVIVVYGVTFGLLLPALLREWPYSPFYISGRDDIDVVRRVVHVRLLFPDMLCFFSFLIKLALLWLNLHQLAVCVGCWPSVLWCC